MEKIISQIEKLLIQNDYVIIPGLGGFIVQVQPAKITSTEIIPPLSIVCFNVRMNNNDGLLATEILRSENTNYRDANKLIDAEIEKIKNRLYSEDKIKLGRLGYLYLNAEQQIAFNSSKEYELLPANFGLKAVYPVRRNENNSGKLTISISSKNMFRYAAAILILFGIFFFSPKINESNFSDYAGIMNIPLSLFESAERTDIINVEQQKSEELIELEINPDMEYHVIVSCLAGKKAAEYYCNSLHAKQYNNAYILPSARTNRIVIQSFSDKETAVLYMRKLKKNNPEFKDAWLHQELIEN